MTALLIISTILSCVYFWYSMRNEIPVSLSATYYTLGENKWVFQAWLGVVVATLFPVWAQLGNENHQCLAFLACASLLFVAAAPAFKLELEGKVHYTSAVVCCVCAVLWQILDGLWDVTLFFGWVGGMLSLAWRDKWCWWMECAVVGSVFANLWRII